MIRSCLTVAVFLGVALAADAARADTPAWCRTQGVEKTENHVTPSEIRKDKDYRSALAAIVATTCFPREDQRKDAKEYAQVRAEWGKRFLLSEADWADVALWVTAYNNRWADKDTRPAKDKKIAWSAMGPVEQWAGITNLTWTNHNTDLAYRVDAYGAKLTQAGRLAYITQCVGEKHPVYWAICNPDVAEYDRAKLAAELRTDQSRSGVDRMNVRIAAYELEPKLFEHKQRVKELLPKDPAYAQMFQIAESVRKEWTAKHQSELAELLALVASIEDAWVTGSRKAAESCPAQSWAAFKKVVGAVPAKKFAGLRHRSAVDQVVTPFLGVATDAIVGEPAGFLAGLALNACDTLDRSTSKDYLVRSVGGSLQYWPGFRGPRSHAHLAILQANLKLDDRDAQIEFPGIQRAHLTYSSGSSGGGRGTIKSIKAAGDKVTITFVNVKVKQSVCTKGRQTNRITQIRSDGQLVYEYQCLAEKTETITVPESQPQTVKARYAEGLKPGMYVETVEDVVTVAYPKGGTTPVMVAGVPVK